MAALTTERAGRVEKIHRDKMPLGKGVKAFKGGAACWDTRQGSDTRGYIIPADVVEGLLFVGRFGESVDNSNGDNGSRRVRVELHRTITTIWWDNSTNNKVIGADRGSKCYFEDDHTVTSDPSTKSCAGTVWSINDNLIAVALEGT